MVSKRILMALPVVGILLGPAICTEARAQTIPGLSVGAFYERRVENKIDGEELSFDYYGARLAVRDEYYFNAFVDIGQQKLKLDPYEDDDAGAFGVGATLWFMRGYDMDIAMDLGLAGSFYMSEHTLSLKDSDWDTDAKYTRYTVQAVLRMNGFGPVKPYGRAGMLGTSLDPDEGSKEDATKPAVNIGVEIEFDPFIVLSLEGNYYDEVGGAAHLDLWF